MGESTDKNISSIDNRSNYFGVDELNKKRTKYKNITEKFKESVESAPDSMTNFIKTKGLVDYLNGLFNKFSSNTINISVVAEVSSGKSTFLNALIFGKKVLDAKMGETTAKVFKISYGENINSNTLKERITNINLKAKNKISDENFLLEDIVIDDYIEELIVDNENLKKGIVLYDTPGFGTLNEKVMSRLIKEAVNRSDAVVLLLDISKGLKKDEAKFIEEALSYIKENKRFIVLNKFDAAIDENEDESEIKDQIDKVVIETKNELIKISPNINKKNLDEQTYYLSAIKALSGKLKNNSDILEFSRFSIFEESFWERIVMAKKEIFNENIDSLTKQKTIIIEEAKQKKDNFNFSIKQTKSIVKNIENTSTEIKEIVLRNRKIINSLSSEIKHNNNIVSNEIYSLEKNINTAISTISKDAIDLISNTKATQEDFIDSYKDSVCKINKKFEFETNEFIKKITNDLLIKEKKVNHIINSLNKEITNKKFKKLNLEKISIVKKININNSFSALNESNNGDFHIESNKLDENNNLTSVYSVDTVDTVDTVTAGAAGATIGGGIGATIGSVIPVVGTAVGAAIGTLLGTVAGSLAVSNGYKKRYDEQREKMEREHRQQMQKMAEENYKKALDQAKKDFAYELKSNAEEHIGNFIAKKRVEIDNDYRNTLSEIISTIYNAKNILKDMQTIIEDPSEQKKIISKNEKKIEEINLFISDVEKCF